jgi:hypothetical protein
VKKVLFFLISLDVLSLSAYAQKLENKLRQTHFLEKPYLIGVSQFDKEHSIKPITQHYDVTKPILQFSVIDHNAAAQHLPFFCEQELKMDKQFKMQVRFRVGNIQCADWLEQKPNAIDPR